MAIKVPYTQQFSPEQTPLKRLLPILRQNAGNRTKLRGAIAAAFFKDNKSPNKVAGNSLIALKAHGIIGDKGELTEFGKQLVGLQGEEHDAHGLLARHIIFDLHCLGIVETLREMNRAGLKVSLGTLPEELQQRGFQVNRNSSDLSNLLQWLREAKILSEYQVDETAYQSVVGASGETLDALKELSVEQVAFLRATVALNVQDWTPYNKICNHAESLFAGEVRYNWKEIVKTVLDPLAKRGMIEVRKREKQDKSTPQGRGGKPADVKPTGTFEQQVAEPLLASLYASAGYSEIREIRSKSLADVVAEIEQRENQDKRGRALELLTVRLCQLLDLQFMGWRETDVDIAGGGEVDALLHTARLIYSRWQIQCKVGPITLEAVAKEVGMREVTLANVILIVSTQRPTQAALTYRQKIISTSNLNIVFVDGPALKRIIQDNSALVYILREQAEAALKLKPAAGLRRGAGSGDAGGGPQPISTGDDSSRMGSGHAERADASAVELKPAYRTNLGVTFCGDSLQILPALVRDGFRAKLIMTSPPFALVRKKAYGNEDADAYVRWFEQFIPIFQEILEPEGSVVIDIGGSWLKGIPAKSTYHFKLLIKLCESGFYLAQDFYHYNPSRLPTPAEWVTVRRLRVKDSINNVWWLTRDPFVKVDNRNVLAPYSEAMKALLRNGYKPALRPSGHDISDKFQKDNGGAIPPNLLTFANTESNSYYLRRCKEEGIRPHPARFPQALPEFFIKFLTSPGDVVIDPFAGSNVTGVAAETLGRKWISIEMDSGYVDASRFRFEHQPAPKPVRIYKERSPEAEMLLPFG